MKSGEIEVQTCGRRHSRARRQGRRMASRGWEGKEEERGREGSHHAIATLPHGETRRKHKYASESQAEIRTCARRDRKSRKIEGSDTAKEGGYSDRSDIGGLRRGYEQPKPREGDKKKKGRVWGCWGHSPHRDKKRSRNRGKGGLLTERTR